MFSLMTSLSAFSIFLEYRLATPLSKAKDTYITNLMIIYAVSHYEKKIVAVFAATVLFVKETITNTLITWKKQNNPFFDIFSTNLFFNLLRHYCRVHDLFHFDSLSKKVLLLIDVQFVAKIDSLL